MENKAIAEAARKAFAVFMCNGAYDSQDEFLEYFEFMLNQSGLRYKTNNEIEAAYTDPYSNYETTFDHVQAVESNIHSLKDEYKAVRLAFSDYINHEGLTLQGMTTALLVFTTKK